jgi:signal transduction histidine kinase
LSFSCIYSFAGIDVQWANDQLRGSLLVYEDREGNKTIDDIRAIPLSLFQKGNEHQNFGFTTSAWWMRFELKNNHPLDVDLYLHLANGHIHDVRFYAYQNTLDAAFVTGNHYPFSSRPVKFAEYLFPIKIPGHSTATCFLRLEKKGAELNAPLKMLPGSFDFAGSFNRWNLFFGSAFLYILILFIAMSIIRTRVILYYFIYAACLCLYMASAKGITSSVLWPDNLWMQTNILELSKHLANVFYILFILKFIGWNTNFHKINLFLRICILACLLNIVCRLIYSTTGWIPDVLMMRFVQFTALGLPLADGCLIYLLYQSWKSGHQRDVFWLMMITIALMIPLSFLVALHFGWIPAMGFYPNMLVVMFLMEIICISIIIIYRYYEMYAKEMMHLREITHLRKKAVENILLGQEEERIRIAKDLHDGISLSLANVRMRLSSIENKMEEEPDKKSVGELVALLGSTAQEVRNISHNLAPLSLQHQELTHAIEELVYQIELNDSNLDIEFHCSPDINNNLSAVLKQNIYQTIKELFSNILKYAKATRIKVSLLQDQQQLLLEVEDNGISYDYPESLLHGNGVGLSSIQSRATLLNGRFDAFPRAGGGMLHLLKIPHSV